jgi:hypothetical protein
MRLKKAKETESKSHTVDGINRLICTSKSQSHSLKGVYIVVIIIG